MIWKQIPEFIILNSHFQPVIFSDSSEFRVLTPLFADPYGPSCFQWDLSLLCLCELLGLLGAGYVSGFAVGWCWSWRGAEEEGSLPGFTVVRKAAGVELSNCTS